MMWPWSKPKPEAVPAKDAAAEHAKASRKAAHAELMEALSAVASDAVDTIRDSMGRPRR